MRRVERTRLLLAVVERLAQEEWPKIDLVLGQFGGSRTDDWQGSKAAYVGWSLESVTDEALSELGEFFGLSRLQTPGSHHEFGVIEESAIKRIWGEGSTYRLFLSHISAFKIEAMKLKEALSNFGISAFVAHADIRPTKEWLDEILRALKTMNALAALLVPDFRNSNWTDQEVGYAIGRGIPIIPLKYNQDPYGFIGRFQALNCTNQIPYTIAGHIARLLIEHDSTQTSVADAIARRLVRAGSYAHAKQLMDLLEVPTSLPGATLDLVADAQKQNAQVRESWGVPDRITALFRKHNYKKDSSPVIATSSDEIPF